jgi:3'(2'), 5'-bisphosphate nucleotidase
MEWKSELDAALDAAALACDVITKQYERLAALAAAPADVTTQTDRDSQEAVLNRLATQFPRDGYRAEETTPTLGRVPREGGRLWVIDPIDGTRGFVMKNGEFSVMIALVVDGEVVVGVVAEPAFSRYTYAARGTGCFQRAGDETVTRVIVGAAPTLTGATLVQSHNKAGQGPPPEVTAVNPARVVETYSAGVKLARVADGSADLYVCTYAAMNDWDIAAGHILVTEAGGRVSTLAGADLRFGSPSPVQTGGLLATNGLLHEAAVTALSALPV